MIVKDQHSKYSKRIANYLYNDMTDSERRAFDEDLLVNSELAEEYKFQEEVIRYLKAKTKLESLRSSPDLADAEKIANELLGSESEHCKQPNTKKALINRKSYRRILSPIIAAAAVLAVFFMTRNMVHSGLNDRLYSSYYEPFDVANFALRGAGTNEQDRLVEAIGLYQNEAYPQASELLSELILMNPESPEVPFFLALSNMGEGDFAQAAGLFNQFLRQFDKYRPEAQWYLSLCYLKLNEPGEAEQQLNQLTNTPGILGVNSQKMLKKLN